MIRVNEQMLNNNVGKDITFDFTAIDPSYTRLVKVLAKWASYFVRTARRNKYCILQWNEFSSKRRRVVGRSLRTIDSLPNDSKIYSWRL